MVDFAGSIERLRQPEYTGDNRCVPCTILNVLIAALLTAVVAVVSLPAAPIVLGLSLAAIYVRGYLIPGTPTLTKRYFPDRVLAAFDKAPEPTGAALEIENGAETGTETETQTQTETDRDLDEEPVAEAVDPERFFLERGIVAPCSETGDGTTADDPDDLCLTDEVRTAWRDAIDAVRDGDRERQVAAFLERKADAVTVRRTDGQALARVDGRLVARWESDAALIADLAGSRTLADRVSGWETLPLEQRSRLASGLRAFAEHCPVCDGPVSIGAETVESCCRSYDVYAISCDDCGERVLEVQQ